MNLSLQVELTLMDRQYLSHTCNHEYLALVESYK